VTALGVSHPLLDEGLGELVAALEAVGPAGSDTFRVVVDLKIARGLDYYTGIVFEGRQNADRDQAAYLTGVVLPRRIGNLEASRKVEPIVGDAHEVLGAARLLDHSFLSGLASPAWR